MYYTEINMQFVNKNHKIIQNDKVNSQKTHWNCYNNVFLRIYKFKFLIILYTIKNENDIGMVHKSQQSVC